MMKNRLHLLIGVGGSLLVVVLWWFLAWTPQTAALADADNKLQSAQDARDGSLKKLGQLQRAKQNEPALRAQLDRLRQAVPEQPDLDALVLAVNSAAASAGVDYATLSQAEPADAEGPGLPTMAVSIDASGGYRQMLDFVDRLNALSRLMVIDSITLSSGGGPDAGANPLLTGSLAGRAFTSKVRPVTPPAPTSVPVARSVGG